MWYYGKRTGTTHYRIFFSVAKPVKGSVLAGPFSTRDEAVEYWKKHRFELPIE